MPLSMSSASIPLFTHHLGVLSCLLNAAEAHATARNIDPALLLAARLYPDMHPLIGQVQIACDFAKGAVARLAGAEVPSYTDDEATIEDLRARLSKTLNFVKSVDAIRIDGSEDRPIALKFGGAQLAFRGEDYLVRFAMPNFLFHVTTAYAILRQCGVPLGKADFLGATLHQARA